jgi:hypothetical protein
VCAEPVLTISLLADLNPDLVQRARHDFRLQNTPPEFQQLI